MAVPGETLTQIVARMQSATCPEDLFGVDGAQANRVFRHLAQIVHPDHHFLTDDHALATDVFPTLLAWWQAAEAKIGAGTYGDRKPTKPETTKPRRAGIRVRKGRREFVIETLLTRGEIANIYDCAITEDDADGATGRPVAATAKIVRVASDNDLLERETTVLEHLSHTVDSAALHPFLPQVIDTFIYRDAADDARRRVTVFAAVDGLVSLAGVRASYPAGIDPRDMAWMWRRLLFVLGGVHHAGVVHGAILPENVLIHPAQHGLMLTNWEYAAQPGQRIPAIVSRYAGWYPAEVAARQPPGAGTDIAMGARLMRYLIGGDPAHGTGPAALHPAIDRFFRGCVAADLVLRPDDAWQLLKEFDVLIERLYGPRTFRPFIMPAS